MMPGDASAVSSAVLVVAPCSAPPRGHDLPRCSAAVRSSPGTRRRCAPSSVRNRDRRSEQTPHTSVVNAKETWGHYTHLLPHAVSQIATNVHERLNLKKNDRRTQGTFLRVCRRPIFIPVEDSILAL